MQAIRNKLHSKSKRSEEKRRSLEPVPAPISAQPSVPSAVVTSFNESHVDLPGKHVDHYEKTEVLPPPLPSDSSSALDMDITPPLPVDTVVVEERVEVFPTESVRTMEVLPTEVIEMPMIVHESIRKEQVEEIQPVIQVEREKMEIRQIVQPLTDKEIKPVVVEERMLPVEILPTIVGESSTVRQVMDVSTREFDATMRQVVEKTPIIQETEKWRIIEEIQPVIHREVIIPHIIRTSRPMREVIVEAPVMTEKIVQTRSLTAAERERWSAFFSKQVVAREVIVESEIPIVAIPEPAVIRVVPEVHRKEIITETTTTTTTTTAAPIAGSLSGRVNSTTAPLAQPAVVEKTHDVKYGPMGEKITRDTLTTSTVSTTKAI